jgi:hypothetical protein
MQLRINDAQNKTPECSIPNQCMLSTDISTGMQPCAEGAQSRSPEYPKSDVQEAEVPNYYRKAAKP